MATVNATIAGARPVPRLDGQGMFTLLSWVGLAASGDVGDTQLYPEFADRSVQVTGNFGTGGAIILEGSNNGSDWGTLRDPLGDALLFTSADIRSVLEATRYVRPKQSAGSGSSLNVYLYARGISND
jgi:hypothetical protein